MKASLGKAYKFPDDPKAIRRRIERSLALKPDFIFSELIATLVARWTQDLAGRSLSATPILDTFLKVLTRLGEETFEETEEGLIGYASFASCVMVVYLPQMIAAVVDDSEVARASKAMISVSMAVTSEVEERGLNVIN